MLNLLENYTKCYTPFQVPYILEFLPEKQSWDMLVYRSLKCTPKMVAENVCKIGIFFIHKGWEIFLTKNYEKSD